MIESDSFATMTAPMRDIYLARQPIFDRTLRVEGYEVLFRDGPENRAVFSNGDEATSQLLLNAFVGIGLDRVVGDRPAFVNLTRPFLTGRYPLPMAPDRLVLEILEDIEIDAELVEGVRGLVEQGYTLALDDVVFEERLRPLLSLAQIVKIELPRIPSEKWGRHLAHFRRFPVRILAEKVETQAEFELCRDLGFDLFQGYFFSKPQVLTGKRAAGNHASVLQLLARLSDEDVSVDAVEQQLKSDAYLCFKLLRYANSAVRGARGISSVRQAISVLGINGVRTVAMLVTMSEFSRDRPETLKTAMLRALTCESLGRRLPACDPGVCFTAGIISALDAVLGIPLSEVLELLSLSEEVRLAVDQNAGILGEVVRCAVSHERIEGPAVTCADLAAADIREAYLEALEETEHLWASAL